MNKQSKNFKESVIATLELDQQSGHKPTNEGLANRITCLFDHYANKHSQQTPDEKVLDFLERAKEISYKICEQTNGVKEESYEGYFRNVIEIAKLLQREESK